MSSNKGQIDPESARQAEIGESHGLIFGIFPGSATGTESGLLAGPPDDPGQIHGALDELQGRNPLFVVRGYLWYDGAGKTSHYVPSDVQQYAGDRRKLDLVLCFRDPAGDLRGWLDLVRETIQRYGPDLTSLQIAEEPNNPNPDLGGDGSFPNVHEAIVQGIVAAKEEALRLGHDLRVGFNSTPSFQPDPFWPRMGALATQRFLDSLDYVGLDFFADVFRPLAPDGQPGDVRSSVAALLKGFRGTNLAAGNIPPSVPIHICENGWSTGPGRSYERQAAVLETVVRTIYAHAAELNITHYEHFGLRDADSSNPDPFHQFGLLRDDYTPKPAFHTYRRLIAELGSL